MIFAIEGIVTCIISIIAFFTLTDRPQTARWLSQAEKDLAIARIKSERVGQNSVLDKLDKKKTLRGIFNPTVLATAFIFLLDNITVQGLAFFLPTIVRTIYPKNTTVFQQLHTVPPYIVGAFFTVLLPFISWRVDRRTILMICSAPFMMIGYISKLALSTSSPICAPKLTRLCSVSGQQDIDGSLCSNLPHCVRRLLLRRSLQRPGFCQRRLRHRQSLCHWHRRYVRQHWRSDFHVELLAF